MIQIFARGTRTIMLEIEPENTVGMLKDTLWDREGVPSSYILVTHAGKVLEDDRTLVSYGISQESTIEWRVRFGPPRASRGKDEL
jgi:hypothetical protein